jgi:hypothetical protein
MYQYTTTNVINSAYALDYDGNILLDGSGSQIPKFSGSTAGLNVVQVGNFKTANILSLYKRPYTAAVLEVAEVTIPTIASGLVARLDVVIKLSGSTNSDYANYSLDFQKPITVEIVSSGTASTDATALVAQLNTLKNRFGQSYFTAAVNSSTKVRITMKEAVQKVKSMVISKEDTSQNTMVQPKYTDVTASTFTIVTVGKEGFGDNNWMLRKIMLPTAENVRHFGLTKGDRPVMGGNYTQYTIRYSVTKDGGDGIVAGGTSVTTHVFYVLSTLVSSFETEIAKLSLGALGLMVVTADDVTLANSATAQASATGAIGVVTWSVTSGTSATVNASTGIITAHSATDGETVVRGTDAIGNYAEVTITVA